MKIKAETSLIEKITKKYENHMQGCLKRKKEVDAWIETASEDEALCLRFLYAYMHPADLVSYHVSEIAAYVKASLEMYENIPYAKQVPVEIFFTYVLSARVNNENLDQSRAWLYEELKDRVKNAENMTQAALEVNYWCYEKATYIPSDNRTIAPFGMCKSAMGRCGEESTLAVCAMRSVGIPARQCYVPRWAHCDDNHAWVEVWVDGDWHYMGACEPEAILDKGWFSAAASKSMLVHTKAGSDLEESDEVAARTPLYSLMNVTKRYADCVNLNAKLYFHGQPVEGVDISFSLINYSELFCMYKEKTDKDGCAHFLTGRGDLYVSAVHDGYFIGVRVDTRLNEEVILKVEDGIRPEELSEVYNEMFDLNPPIESMPKAVPAKDKELHEERLAQCEEIRSNYETSFKAKSPKNNWAIYYEYARGNADELLAFEKCSEYQREDKEALLSTLRAKDLIDTTADILLSYLRNAYPYKEKYSSEIYKKYILAPRVANEMLTGKREKIAALLKEEGINLQSAKEVWDYLNDTLTILPDYEMNNMTADAFGSLSCKTSNFVSIPIIFVEICRSLGIPARINPITGKPEAVYEDKDRHYLNYEEMDTIRAPKAAIRATEPYLLTLINGGDSPLEYYLHMTIAKYENGSYHTLHYGDLKIEKQESVSLQAGSYRILTTRRQIDGGVSAKATYFVMNGQREIILKQSESKTAQKLYHTALADTLVTPIQGVQTGQSPLEGMKACSMKSLYAGQKSILIFADPGKEPTEHLFQELIECRQAYIEKNYRVVIALSNEAAMKNETLKRLCSAGLNLCCVKCTDDAYLYELHEKMHVGDERLPFALAVNEKGEGLFAFANYNIRTAWTLMEILDC